MNYDFIDLSMKPTSKTVNYNFKWRYYLKTLVNTIQRRSHLKLIKSVGCIKRDSA